MDVERSSLCNCVVNFLLEENYLLLAFELLEDGRDDQAIRLKEFFSDPTHFPPDQISHFNSLRVADPQTLLDEKVSLEEKLAVSEYELRLAQEDMLKLKAELLKKIDSSLYESSGPNMDVSAKNGPINQPMKRDISFSDLGPLKDNERLDINCAVKEYLLLAGYRLTAMTFYEEVTDQNLDVWQNSSACVPDALRHYYYHYLSSTAEAAEEKIATLRENDWLKNDKQSLLKSKEMSDAQIIALTKSSEALKKDVKDKENLVQGLKKTLENQRKELNDCRAEITSLKMHIEGAQSEGLGTIQILSNALPKIVPYVLINHREELLPLIMCAIERHPDSAIQDSLTHTLFNLIKRPDEQQRRIIMDACVTLAKNVGELRTETELLPQCWEQINHMYEERRLLVAQSCGELAEFVRPEIRDSLILSIVQQLIEDSATVVREAAAHNLALLLLLFPNTDKYFKVEEMMFQLVCNPSGIVVETTIKELVPALINWGNKLDHILQVILSHILSSAQCCPPLSGGVEGSIESHLRVLGERERWNVDVLLRLLAELLSRVHQNAVETCPFPGVSNSTGISFSPSLLELYAGGHEEWPSFEWLHIECFPSLIRLASLSSPKEDSLRNHVTRFLLAAARQFGESYLTHIMLPVFLVAVGNDADLKFFPFKAQPETVMAQTLATMCVLPLLLAGVLAHPRKREHLTEYLRNLLIQSSGQDGQPAKHDIINSVCFICTFEEHHSMIFDILWEMVVSSDVNLKISAANLLKVIVPYIDAKVASTHVLPALVTLGSDQNLNVKYASIDAFGAIAQHFKNDMIVDKIRIQMDAFLEDGSHEATIAVVRAVVSVPHTTNKLQDYILSTFSWAYLFHLPCNFKNGEIFNLTASQPPSSDVLRRRERANAFCESIRALDATDLPASSVRDLLLPAIQNLLKDTDALDPAHKEALEIIFNERSGGAFDAISKVMGAHIGLASSVSSFFGESRLLGKKESGDPGAPPPATIEPQKTVSQPPVEDTRFRRIMRGGFTDMIRAKAKSSEETQSSQ
ncbi:hypothetical protein Pfo_019224 [Paulownia fortunei]|nr:hypothetical protein Pfo_019224 [Paulownia fortunei]